MADKTASYRYKPLHQDIICHETAIDELARTVDALGCGRVMITCGPTILQACNVVPRVQEALGQRYVGTYSGVAPHSPVETVEAGVEMAKEVQPDMFISVGGGSTHDTTKAMATLLAEGGRHPRLRDHFRADRPDNRAADSLTQTADTERAHHYGLCRIQQRRGRYHRPSPGAQTYHGGRGRDAPYGHNRRAGLGHDAAAHPRFHGHRTAAHRH